MNTQPIAWDSIEALLHRVQKPGRYVGGEYHAVQKPWDAAAARVCLAFPDVYEIGMSNFALMLLYDILNRRPEWLAERAYLPAPDMLAEMRRVGLPLYSLESYRPVAAFDVIGISLAYEHLYTNVLEFLDLAGIPLHSAARDARHPLIIGGGHSTFNVAPMDAFCDAVVIGEGEEAIVEIVEAVERTRGQSREAQLRALLPIPGVYVPRFYREDYAADGRLCAVTPLDPAAPPRIARRLMATLPPTPVQQLVPNVDTPHNRGVIEIQRGCTRGCRFCQAGIITRPVRERPAAEIEQSIAQIVAATGYEEIALLSLSSADHSQIGVLMDALRARFTDYPTTFSLPSLRIDAFSIQLADAMSGARRSGFTFAPEAGSDALRNRINKNIPTADLLHLAEEVFSRGWRTLKLYFMLGLPGETDADIEALIEMVQAVRRIGRRVGGRKTEVHVSVNTFVPKPQTVFQWEPLADVATVERRQQLLRAGLHGGGLSLSWNQYAETRLEALLARGDRRLSAVIERAWRLGARFDAWTDWRNAPAWEQAFTESDLDWDAQLYRPRAADEVFPWDHLSSGVERRFLWQDHVRSDCAELLEDCRNGCHACGILQNHPESWTEEWQCPTP